VHTPSEEKIGDSKESCYEYLEQVLFYHFLKHHSNILLGDFNAKVGIENIFKTTIRNESVHQGRNEDNVRIVYFAISTILVVRSTMFPHRNIHKYTRITPEGKTHNQIDHIFMAYKKKLRYL